MSPVAESGVVVAPGASEVFAIGGVEVRLSCQAGNSPLVLPAAYRLFHTDYDDPLVNVGVGTVDALDADDMPIIYGGGHHWRARGDSNRLSFEIFFPPTAETYCRMHGDRSLTNVSVDFGRENLARLPDEFIRQSAGRLWLPHPFDQIAFLPALARRGGFLVHACGAVIDGRAFVFAGHSGDGKTTLSRLLADEGVELLSDERVAVTKSVGGFFVHGTPWTGEGEVVSSARFPLGGVFLLRKASSHRVVIERGAVTTLAAEVLARSLVPYYLREEAARILSLVRQMARAVSFGELEFSLRPGLAELLARLDPRSSVA